MVLWQLVNLGTRCTVTHCRIALWSHQSAQTASSERCIMQITSFSGAPRGAFQQPVYNKCKVPWLRVLARPLQAVHNGFLSEILGCALS